MVRNLKRAMCLLLILAAACAMLTVATLAAEERTAEVSVQSRAAALATPMISKFENTESGVNITWGAVNGAAAYRVFLKTATGWKTLATTKSTSYTYTSVSSGTAYTFTVRCVSADGSSFTSDYQTSGWTWTYVAQPTISSLENRVTGVKLTWNSVPGAERYRIYVKQPGGSWDYVGNTMGNTFTYIWVESGEDYIFTICCANKDNNLLTSSFNTEGWRITYIGQPLVTKMESVAAGVKLTWNSVPGAERYRVYLKNDSAWEEIGTTTDSSFVYTGARDGKTYTFTVCCVNEANDTVTSSSFESGWHHTYDNPGPVELDIPRVTKLENVAGGVKITWGPVDGAERYRVYVRTGSGWMNIGNTTGNSFVYDDVTGGEKYTFTVRCVNDANNAFTSSCNATGWSTTYVAAPRVTKLENVANGVKITWGAQPGAERYRVYLRTKNGWQNLGSTTDTSFVYTNVTGGETYAFTVRCVNKADNAFTSTCNSAGWSVTYVAWPRITRLENVADGVKITWGAQPGAERYRVYVKTSAGWKNIGSTTDTSFIYSDVTGGEKYTFTVRCVNDANNAFTSTCNSIGWSITYVATPSIADLKNTSEGIELTWDAEPGAVRYRVYVKTSSGWVCIGNTSETSFVWDGAQKGKTYTFTIRCVNEANTAFTSHCNTTGWSIACK